MGSDGPVPRWRKSSHSGGSGQCVELTSAGAVRDSKNAHGPVIRADLDSLVEVVRTGRFDR